MKLNQALVEPNFIICDGGVKDDGSRAQGRMQGEETRQSGGGGKDLSNPPPRSHVQVNVDVTCSSPEKEKVWGHVGAAVAMATRRVLCLQNKQRYLFTAGRSLCVCACVSQITANSQITGIMEDGCEGSIHRNNNNNARTHTHTHCVNRCFT